MSVTVKGINVGGNAPIVMIAGPCQLESLDHARMMTEEIAKACAPTGTNFIFKASFDKANRTSGTAKRGMGIDAGLDILGRIRDEFDVAVLTDVHLPEQCHLAAEVCDVLQIPAFLCRQTDLLEAAAETGKAINIKKGQFLAPWDMANVAEKVSNNGNSQILLTERGTSFGYNTLVNDFRGLSVMAQTGYPVIFDATHSVQQPGGQGASSGGQREFVAPLAKAACAIGVAGVFLESSALLQCCRSLAGACFLTLPMSLPSLCLSRETSVVHRAKSRLLSACALGRSLRLMLRMPAGRRRDTVLYHLSSGAWQSSRACESVELYASRAGKGIRPSCVSASAGAPRVMLQDWAPSRRPAAPYLFRASRKLNATRGCVTSTSSSDLRN